jgi:two-component system, OmpR family, phosphate regulon response regulator PhoB
VLVIEDDPDLRELLAYNLASERFDVRSSETGYGGLKIVQRFSPDIVLLDLVLPDIPGTYVYKCIRGGQGHQPAVMVVTAKGDEIDRVVGFELGVDDYVVKPFSVRELILRVRAILRSRGPLGSASPLTRSRIVLGSFEFDGDRHQAFVNGQAIPISRCELRLLSYFVENQGQVLSREHLLKNVWGHGSDASSRTVDTNVARLRRRIGDSARFLQSVRGVGYRLVMEAPAKVERSPAETPS